MNDRPPVSTQRRTFLVLLGVGLFDMTVMGRLVGIQGLNARRLQALADEVHFRAIPLAAPRGNIVDRTGRLLAGSHHVLSLYARPLQTRGRRAQEAVLLAELTGLAPELVLRRLHRRQGFVWLKRHLSPLEADAVKSQLSALPGIYLIAETTRYYPQGHLAGPVLGFTGIDNQGLAGLELTYNRVLAGRPGKIEEEYTAQGEPLIRSQQRVTRPQAGDSLRLSLDSTIQWIAERACERAMAETGAKSVSVVAVNPTTGGVLALAQRPSFDPNFFRQYEARDYRVWAVSDTNPPGSIFKPITLAAALEAGTTSAGSGFFCPGFKIVAGRKVNCWRLGGHGPQSLSQVVMNSCNVGFMDLGLGLGVDAFYHWIDAFQLNGKSHIDLPGEARSILPAASRVTSLDLAVMAFGQTLTVTSINLLNSVAAIANRGVLLKPHVVDTIQSPQGKLLRRVAAEPVGRVISPANSRLVQEMMVGVVSRGTGKQAKIPGYRIAGKTGTAQKVVNGRVMEGVYIASFVGFAPVPDPQVALMVNIDEPKGAFYGGQVAAPVFRRVMQQILHYWRIPPSHPIHRPAAGESVMVPDLVDLDPSTAENDAAVSGFPVQFTGEGDVVVAQSVEYGGWRPAGTVVRLRLGKRPVIYLQWVTVPDFRQLTVAAAHRLASGLGLNVDGEETSNVVRGQSIAPGSEVKAGTTVWLQTG